MENIDYTSHIKPTWCPGCGNFGIFTALKQTMAELKLPRENVVLVCDVGCAGNSADFYNTYVFHALHGRALPPAAGIKLANHDLTVIAIVGDGGLFGEATTHLMNLIRGNHNITVIHHNNYRYSLTTGQYAPTTPKGTKTPSTPEGVIEEAIRPIEFVLSCRPGFVARSSALKPAHLKDIIKKAIVFKGFSFVDVLQPCVTFNKDQTIAWYQNIVEEFNGPLSLEKAKELAVREDKLPIGLFYADKRPAYHVEVSTLQQGPLVKQKIDKIDISKLLEFYK